VVLPVISLVRAVVTSKVPWLLGSIGVALAPAQALALLAAGHLLFARDPVRSTFALAVAAALRQPMETAAMLTALAAGGLVLGLLAARRHQVREVQLVG